MPSVFQMNEDVMSRQQSLLEKVPQTKAGSCLLNWDDLQLQGIDVINSPPMTQIEAGNLEVHTGGHWHPKNCTPFQKVAVIIPYRDRWFHVRILLNRLHPMLRLQQIDYRIFVIEQRPGTPFNRGLLLNLGIIEALKFDRFDCFIFHDVDLIPEHDRNVYLCDDNTRHLSSAIDEMRYHVLFESYAGGVAALTRENVLKTNGYSNVYWGWGNEDDDFSARTYSMGLKLSRPPEYIGRYKMIRHKKAVIRVDGGYRFFLSWRERQFTDGLNSITSEDYRVINIHEAPLYTNVTIDLIQPLTSVPTKKQESLLWFLRFYGYLP